MDNDNNNSFFNEGTNYFNFNNENFLSYKLLNLPELVAKRASNQLWGNGYLFESENEEIQKWIDYIEEKINLLDFFYSAEKIHSVYGLAQILINVIPKSNYPSLHIAVPWGVSRTARIQNTELGADIMFKYVLDDKNFWIRATIDSNKIVFSIQDDNKEIIIGGMRETILKDLKLPNEITYDYDFIPIIFSQNLPKANFWGDSNLGSIYPDGVSVEGVQKLMYKTFDSIYHELEFNKTRAFANLTQQEINKLRKQMANDINQKGQIKKLFLKDFLLQVQGRGQTNTNKLVEVLVGNPQFDKYILLLNWCINTYFTGCGYSSESEGTKTETAFEVNVKQSDDIETTRMKRTFRQKTYGEMLRRLLIMVSGNKEIRKSDFTFMIKENNILDKNQETERIKDLLAMNLITREQALKEIHGLSDEEAQELLEKINEQNKNDELLERNRMEEEGEQDKQESEQVDNEINTIKNE